MTWHARIHVILGEEAVEFKGERHVSSVLLSDGTELHFAGLEVIEWVV